jgi:hypothetical protein
LLFKIPRNIFHTTISQHLYHFGPKTSDSIDDHQVIFKYHHPKPLHIAWMMSGNAQTKFEQPLNMLFGKITSGIVAM